MMYAVFISRHTTFGQTDLLLGMVIRFYNQKLKLYIFFSILFSGKIVLDVFNAKIHMFKDEQDSRDKGV